MAMFTKLFTRSHFPYELKGRWYKLTVSADKDTGYLSVVKSDIPVFDEDAPAFGYNISDNILFVMNGYIIDYAFMTLSGGVTTNAISFGNEIDPELGVLSSLTAEGLSGNETLFDLYLYIVKSNGIPNSGSGSDDSGSDDSGSDDSGSDDHDIH